LHQPFARDGYASGETIRAKGEGQSPRQVNELRKRPRASCASVLNRPGHEIDHQSETDRENCGRGRSQKTRETREFPRCGLGSTHQSFDQCTFRSRRGTKISSRTERGFRSSKGRTTSITSRHCSLAERGEIPTQSATAAALTRWKKGESRYRRRGGRERNRKKIGLWVQKASPAHSKRGIHRVFHWFGGGENGEGNGM